MNLLVFGLGYSGRAIARAAVAVGHNITATTRGGAAPEPSAALISFDAAQSAIAAATHIIVTAAPEEQGDPVLTRYGAQISAASNLKYIGYLSTTGVYGNADGAWVDEDTPPNPSSERARRRVAAERAWMKFPISLDIIRLAGIYGPGRSMFDDLRAGAARCVVKPGHLFGRIHRDDIAHGVLKAIQRSTHPGVSIFNFTDDEPAASADVVVEAARLLGVPPPEPVPYEIAAKTMSAMALSFWAENRRVSNTKTKAALNLVWKYPTYREGLRTILAAEQPSSPPSQNQPKKL